MTDGWYMYKNGEYESITPVELNDISVLNDRDGMGVSSKPYVVGVVHGEGHSEYWLRDGYLHRYYGEAKKVGSVVSGWYLNGRVVKGW